jgi:hypothetical protein
MDHGVLGGLALPSLMHGRECPARQHKNAANISIVIKIARIVIDYFCMRSCIFLTHRVGAAAQEKNRAALTVASRLGVRKGGGSD